MTDDTTSELEKSRQLPISRLTGNLGTGTPFSEKRVYRASPRRGIITSHMRGHLHSLEVMRTNFDGLLSAGVHARSPSRTGMKWD